MPLATHSRLSDALRNRLAEKSWAQKKLAEFLGRDESTVSLWVSGRQSPRVEDTDSISKLAKFLDTTADHVRSLISAQKEPDASQPPLQQRVTSLNSFLTLLENNAFLRPLIERQVGRTSLAGLRDRLFEEGYSVEETVLEKYLSNQVSSQEKLRRGAVPSLGGMAALRPSGDSVEYREAVRQACRALNGFFSSQGNTSVKAAAAASARAACAAHLGDASAPCAERILEHAIHLHLLTPVGKDELIRQWPISAEFVLNSMLGVRTGIRKLDFLLDGGWLPPVEGGLAVLAKGRAGRGKTMFALQAAASFAAQRHVSIYLTAEESASRLLSRLSYAGYSSVGEDLGWRLVRDQSGLQEIEFLSANDIEEGDDEMLVKRSRQTGRGCLVIVELPQRRGLFRPNSRLLLQLEKILTAVRREGRLLLTVFDSLDAIEPQSDRRSQEHLFAFSKLQASIGIMTSEVHDGTRQPSIRDHLSDIILRFDVRERVEGFTERVIEIEKCRTQSHIRGEHMFSIHGGRGISIYPSIQSLLSVWRRRIRSLTEQPVEHWQVLDLNFDVLLCGDLVRGCTMLLTGPPHTHRFLLGLSFLAAALRSDPDKPVLLISLREDPAAVGRIIANYPQLDDLLDPNRSGALHPNLRVLHFPPDYFAPERFVYWLQAVFEEYGGRGVKPSRILFSSMNQLLHNSPMFSVERLFIDALLELFKRKQVTSLFLGSSDPQQEISNVFDVILFTEQGQDNAVSLRVAHSGPCNASSDVRRITKGSHEGRAWLRIEEVGART